MSDQSQVPPTFPSNASEHHNSNRDGSVDFCYPQSTQPGYPEGSVPPQTQESDDEWTLDQFQEYLQDILNTPEFHPVDPTSTADSGYSERANAIEAAVTVSKAPSDSSTRPGETSGAKWNYTQFEAALTATCDWLRVQTKSCTAVNGDPVPMFPQEDVIEAKEILHKLVQKYKLKPTGKRRTPRGYESVSPKKIREHLNALEGIAKSTAQNRSEALTAWLQRVREAVGEKTC
ncbi:hypothetical protein NliqN6_6784 [Naganishia liquefaciens]|uniref:Uncharacterized protein n=1 Tax=Naganishia liquefaciens TaxID=104408 RepID=A0A8H3U067_9TREE|nr:hypothetical protein NliqN6_6784 [Naganishia liquefaciens]